MLVFPIGHDDTRIGKQPWVTYGLILACVILFFAVPNPGTWGTVAADINPVTLVTSMFMHCGFFHLLMNMIFLLIFGPLIEDRLGKGGFLFFYLAAGIVADLAFVMMYRDLTIPALGASGAVCGLMGAFLLFYWRIRIHFFYWFLFFFGTFTIPAWVILPLYLVSEILDAVAMHHTFSGGGGGINHLAHIGGFVFGLAVAGVISILEERIRTFRLFGIARKNEMTNGVFDMAYQLVEKGNYEKALAVIKKALRIVPNNEALLLEYWNLAIRLQQETARASRAFVRMIERHIRDNHCEIAQKYWFILKERFPRIPLSHFSKIRFIEYLVGVEWLDAAKRLLNELVMEVNGMTQSGILARIGKIARRFDWNTAIKTLKSIVSLPGLSLTQKQAFQKELHMIQARQKAAYAPIPLTDISYNRLNKTV